MKLLARNSDRICTRVTRGVLWVLLSATGVFSQTSQPSSELKIVDTAKSTMKVRVLKTGLFSPLGHEHEIQAPIERGSVRDDEPSVEITVDARKLKVIDRDVSDKDRQEVQATMLGPQVLDVEHYPEIRFHSTQFVQQTQWFWIVKGELTLHGQTRPIQFGVQDRSGHYVGSTEIKQTDFGMTPPKAPGGVVKVKNELRVEFEIVLEHGQY